MGTQPPTCGLILSDYVLAAGASLHIPGIIIRPSMAFSIRNEGAAGGAVLAHGYFYNQDTGEQTRFSYGLDMADLAAYGWYSLVFTDFPNSTIAVFTLDIQAKGADLTLSAGFSVADDIAEEFLGTIPENGYLCYQRSVSSVGGSHSMHIIRPIFLAAGCALYAKLESGEDITVCGSYLAPAADGSGCDTGFYGKELTDATWWAVFPADTQDRIITIFVRGSTVGGSSYSLVVGAATPVDGEPI